jgi:hypothetical protein
MKRKKITWLVILAAGIIYMLLLSCTSVPVKNHQDADIMVMQGSKVLPHQTVLLGRQQEIFFSFTAGKSEGMTPKVYVYGPVWVGYTPQYDTVRLKPNVGYTIRIKFSKPGEAVILFIWEGDGAFGANSTVYLKYTE